MNPMTTNEIVRVFMQYTPTWPREVMVGDECYYWDEWVPVVRRNGVLWVSGGPTVEVAVGLNATFRRGL